MTRRGFFLASGSAAGALVVPVACAADSGDPWSKNELLEPAELAKRLQNREPSLHLFCVAFPVLYRQKHIPGSKFAGPTGKAEGLTALRNAVADLPKDAQIVIYCGCCPMANCPNIRPAFQTLKELGYTNLRILNIPTNFHTDWVAKAYPVE